MITVTEHKSRFGVITILKTQKTGSLLYCQGDCYQSEADANGTSLIAYVHGMFDLLRQSGAETVLMIGCGGGTLATMLSKAGRAVTVVDVNPQAFLLARRYFGLPERVACRVADGAEYLLADVGPFDAIVLDAFSGDRIPDHLQSAAFFGQAMARLKPTGAIFANVHMRDDMDDAGDRLATQMAKAWAEVRLLDLPGRANRNAIVMAGEVAELQKPALQMPPAIGLDELDDELAAMEFRPYRSRY